jgi:hypothetical protein
MLLPFAHLLYSFQCRLFICCGVCLEHSTISLERAFKEDFFSVGWFAFELLLLLAVTDGHNKAIEVELLLLLFVVDDECNRAINEFVAPWFEVTELVGTSPVKELISEELVLLATSQLLLEELIVWGILLTFAL